MAGGDGAHRLTSLRPPTAGNGAAPHRLIRTSDRRRKDAGRQGPDPGMVGRFWSSGQCKADRLDDIDDDLRETTSAGS